MTKRLFQLAFPGPGPPFLFYVLEFPISRKTRETHEQNPHVSWELL